MSLRNSGRIHFSPTTLPEGLRSFQRTQSDIPDKKRKEKERREERESQEPHRSKQSDRGSRHRSRLAVFQPLSLTPALFACEARPAAADDKTNRQAPFIQSGVMTEDKQPTAADVSRRWPRSQAGRGRGGVAGGREVVIITLVLAIVANRL